MCPPISGGFTCYLNETFFFWFVILNDIFSIRIGLICWFFFSVEILYLVRWWNKIIIFRKSHHDACILTVSLDTRVKDLQLFRFNVWPDTQFSLHRKSVAIFCSKITIYITFTSVTFPRIFFPLISSIKKRFSTCCYHYFLPRAISKKKLIPANSRKSD